MLEQPVYAAPEDDVRDLVRTRGWALLVTGTPVPVVSHLPIVLEPTTPGAPAELTILGHLARADAELVELGCMVGLTLGQSEALRRGAGLGAAAGYGRILAAFHKKNIKRT